MTVLFGNVYEDAMLNPAQTSCLHFTRISETFKDRSMYYLRESCVLNVNINKGPYMDPEIKHVHLEENGHNSPIIC